MRLTGRAWGLLLLIVTIGVLVWLKGTSVGDSPEHRSDSDGPNGTSALRQLAQRLDHPASVMADSFNPDLGMRLLFVFTPLTSFSQEEAKRAADYVTGGGTLVYAAERGDSQLDFALGVDRGQGLASGEAAGSAGPALAGVARVSGAASVRPLRPSSDQVVLLRDPRGVPLAVEQRIGRGRVLALADPLPLCNGYLDRADNGRLAADLIGLAGGNGQIVFDEYHHGVGGPNSPVTGWLSSAWGASITWAALAVFIGLILRGRAFGPRLVLAPGADRSSAEHVSAVGGLLRRSGATRLTLDLLILATRRALASRHGILGTGEVLDRTLARRAPEQASQLADAERLSAAAVGESGLLAAAARLHHVAHPGEEESP